MPGAQTKETKLPRRTALKQTTLAETIYLELLGRLQRGEIGADDRLLDYEIAGEFDCTRMPARQALMRLVNEGYLMGTTRGFVVPIITARDIREIFEVRRLLEPAAAASVAKTLADEQLDALRRAYEKICTAYERNDVELMIAANTEFRDTWLAGVENTRLVSAIQRFADHVQHVRVKTLKRPETQKVVVESVGAMLDAFMLRDPARIESALKNGMKAAEHEYFESLSRVE
ncbi:GntR family transcriptional regulator [Burkholderia cenocepacia]|uniref:GntR family transcriptional regulator n=1 Tax=Burkholderia cenocepacia TaxID=95486 RepID=UPI00406D4C24